MNDADASSTARQTWLQALSRLVARHPVRMRAVNVRTLLVSVGLAIAALALLGMILDSNARLEAKNDDYTLCDEATQDLQAASDHLTSEAKAYVETGSRSHLDAYIAELTVQDRRGHALRTLKEYADDPDATEALEKAVKQSDELSRTELYAMRLVADAVVVREPPKAIQEVSLDAQDRNLTAAEKRALAHALMTSNDYSEQKLVISTKVQECSSILLTNIQEELEVGRRRLHTLIHAMRICVVSLLLMVGFVISSNTLLLLVPMSHHERHIRDGERLLPAGAQELRYLTDAYNDMYDKNHDRATRLQKRAEIDPLTGAFNRGAYERLLEAHRKDMALVLVDVDNFKHFNDEFGHDMGDAVLTEVAATLSASSRENDHVCRIGGDEFAVVAPGMDSSMQEVLVARFEEVSAFLRGEENGIPSVTVSVGVAFADQADGTDDGLFRAADEALYATKRAGRDGITFAPVAE